MNSPTRRPLADERQGGTTAVRAPRAGEGNRTPDLLITSEPLCRLSYSGAARYLSLWRLSTRILDNEDLRCLSLAGRPFAIDRRDAG